MSSANAGLSTPRAKAGPQRTPAYAHAKSCFGRSAVGHQPRSPRESAASPEKVTLLGQEANGEGALPATALDKESENAGRERGRVRAARAAMDTLRQRVNDETRLREEEQRRRAAAMRERAQSDREAARLSARVTRQASAPTPEVMEERESAWVGS